MQKLALVMASVATLGFATPSFASDQAQAPIQLAQAAGVSVSVGDAPRVRSSVVVRERHDRGYHRGWRHHARGDSVVIVKKRKPAKRTVIIER